MSLEKFDVLFGNHNFTEEASTLTFAGQFKPCKTVKSQSSLQLIVSLEMKNGACFSGVNLGFANCGKKWPRCFRMTVCIGWLYLITLIIYTCFSSYDVSTGSHRITIVPFQIHDTPGIGQRTLCKNFGNLML